MDMIGGLIAQVGHVMQLNAKYNKNKNNYISFPFITIILQIIFFTWKKR